MSWMGKRNAAKREAQRVEDTADIVAEGWWPPVTEHDARMATVEDGCNLPNHDHNRALTDAEVDAALYPRATRLESGIVAEADSQAAEPCPPTSGPGGLVSAARHLNEQQFFRTSLAEHQPGDLTDGGSRGRMQRLTDHGGPR